jgi:hypothetical protein
LSFRRIELAFGSRAINGLKIHRRKKSFCFRYRRNHFGIKKRLVVGAQSTPLGCTISILVLYEVAAGVLWGVRFSILVDDRRANSDELRIPPPHLPWASLRRHRIGGANDHCLNRRSRLVRLDQEAYRQGDAGLDRYWPRPAGSQEESGWLRAFIKWVESEVGIVRRSAQAYMALAKLADDNGAAIALLPPTTAHRLAAKSAPPDVVSEVVAKALSGEVLPDRTVAE